MPKLKWLDEPSPDQEEERLMILNSLKRDGFLNERVKMNNIAKKSDVNETFSLRFNWREKRILLARLRRISSKCGMSVNAWLVWQIKELVRVHDHENL